MKRNNIILPAAAVFLVILYLISFSPAVSGKNSEKAVNTAVINVKYKDTIDTITVTQNGNGTKLVKKNNIWQGSLINQHADSDEITFPVENGQVGRFISNLIKIRKMYKISDNTNLYDDFSLLEESAVKITYRNTDSMYTELYVGTQDFSHTMRFIRTDKSVSIYKMECDFENFLHSEPRFWYDPYLIPQNTGRNLKPEDIQRIIISSEHQGKTHTSGSESFSEIVSKCLSLRHGALYIGQVDETVPPALKLTVELGSGDSFVLKFYPHETDDYIIKYEIGGSWNYSVFISSWTFRSITELLGIDKF